MVALLVLLTILVFLTVDYFVQRRRTVQVALSDRTDAAPVVLHDPAYRTPAGVYFDRNHVWAFLEESGEARVGVDDVTRVVLGRIDRIDAVPAGRKVKRGDKLFELFHGDRSITVRSPIDGTVEDVNEAAARATESGLTSEWLCRIRPNDTSVLHDTMVLGAKASDRLRRELRRLRVFLSTTSTSNPALAETMHDGGMPYAGLVEYLSDADWRKLCETFFNDGDDAAR